jgi:hypothetical protein
VAGQLFIPQAFAPELANLLPAIGEAANRHDFGLRHGGRLSGVRLGGSGFLQAVQEVRRPLRMGCSGEDRPLIVFHHLNPRCYIRPVIPAKLRRQIKVGGQKRGAKLGDKFFHGVAFVAKALATEIAVKARFVASPMGLMPISA